MKTLSLAVLLMASVAFVLVGCSDNPTMPVSASDQAGQVAPSLDKKLVTNITMVHFPVPPLPLPYPANAAITKTPAGIWHLKDVEIHEAVKVTYQDGTVEAGMMLHYLSSTMNAEGEGPVHGSFTMTMAGGGVWEGAYRGYRSLSLPPTTTPAYIPFPPSWQYEFELPLKVVAHGRGGNIEGMKLSATDVIRAHGTPPAYWYGNSEGSFK